MVTTAGRRLAAVVVTIAALTALTALTAYAATRPRTITKAAAPAPTPSPTPAAGASVGPLFVHGLTQDHTCTASVVATGSGDVIATAAHCLSGSGVGAVFAPGYVDGATPYGTWVTTAAYVDPEWTATQDPQHDVAFLTVAPVGSASLQATVGAATLTTVPASSVTVTGYASGRDDSALTCTAAVTTTDGWATFTCGSFPGGTSGGPWVTADGGLVGVIGGLHQGGCTNATSYTSTFTAETVATLQRAATGAAPDVLPVPGSDGC